MAKKSDNAQPARISYVFDKGYRDLGNTIKEAWAMNVEDGKNQFGMVGAGGGSFIVGIHIIAGICIFVFGSIITAITTVLHIYILGVILFVIYVLFGITWLIDRIYIAANRIKNACPNPNCQREFLIPAYECPNCGRIHTKLVPGRYGIWHRTCLCGYKLPTTFLNGRNKLQAYCPHCGGTLEGDTASQQYAIPVIGGPSVGKTCILNMAVRSLINDYAPEHSWDISFSSPADEAKYAATVSSFDNGIRPMKTDQDALTAYQLGLHIPGEKVGKRLYVYDISGEMFANSGDIQRNEAYKYCDGFVFVIDPLTLANYAGEMVDRINIDSYGASEEDFNDILNIMLINLEKMFNLSPKDVLKKNLAVVINKCDIPGLNEQIGDGAAQEYLSSHSECKNLLSAKNALCEQFLEQYGAGNFVRTAQSKFKNVQYFTCSALGHNREGVAFNSVDVLDPFLWILSMVNTEFAHAID